MKYEPTKEQILRIAAEVEQGKRPNSDLEKYGITLGESETEGARERLLAELDDLGFSLDDE